MHHETVPFGTVEVVTDADDEGVEVMIRATDDDYTEEDWNAAATYAAALSSALPPAASSVIGEFTSSTWHPVAANAG